MPNEPEAADPVTAGSRANYSIPGRYRDALYKTFLDTMPGEWVTKAGRWLYASGANFTRGGDPRGVDRFNYELTDVDKHYDAIGDLKSKLVELFPQALEDIGIPDFDLEYIEMHATLYHHGSHFCWHDDAPGYDGAFIPSRRIAYCFYMHSEPKMFTGGELEFLDGTALTPHNNSIVMFHPLQQHRIRKVECYSAELLHGRWAFFGWIHGQPPEGYSEPKLRGVPHSG